MEEWVSAEGPRLRVRDQERRGPRVQRWDNGGDNGGGRQRRAGKERGKRAAPG